MLTQQLTNCGLFRFVVSDSAGVDEALRLDSELIELVQVFDETSSEVRVTIRFDLVDVAQRTILFSDTISRHRTRERASRTPASWPLTSRVQRVLDQLVTQLRDPVTSLQPSNP